MHTSDKPSKDSDQEGRPQPFADFSTMPGGWDLSGQPGRKTMSPATPLEKIDQPSDTPAEPATGDVPWQAQKFTQPRTIPTGWDTSALK
jgi:hypothetical protein